jgi:TonB family protein
MKMPIRALILSIFVHFSIFSLLWNLIQTQDPIRSTPSSFHPIEMGASPPKIRLKPETFTTGSKKKLSKPEEAPDAVKNHLDASNPITPAASSLTDSFPQTNSTFNRIRVKIQEAIHYPRSLAIRKVEGRVIVQLRLNPSGEVTHCEINSSSSFEELDNLVCPAVYRAAPFSLASDLEKMGGELLFNLPIDFKAASNLN